MLQFMGENKRLLNIHEQNFAEIVAFQANTTVFQTNTNESLKNLEVQIGQLALTMQNQSKDYFPSDTRKNSRDCMAVALKSGRELEERKRKRKTLRKNNMQTLRNTLSNIAQRLQKKRKQKRCSQRKMWKNKIQGKRERLRLMNLKFHSLKGCRRQGLKRNSLDS